MQHTYFGSSAPIRSSHPSDDDVVTASGTRYGLGDDGVQRGLSSYSDDDVAEKLILNGSDTDDVDGERETLSSTDRDSSDVGAGTWSDDLYDAGLGMETAIGWRLGGVETGPVVDLNERERCETVTWGRGERLTGMDTPPPLHFSPVTSEQERSSTADTTPIGTPNTFEHPFRRRSDKERDRDLIPSFHRKPFGFAGNTSSYVDSTLLESDFDDSTFPLFQDTPSPDQHRSNEMDSRTATMNLATPPPASLASRRHLTSNLTSALQSTSGNETRPTPAMSISSSKSPQNSFAHRDSPSSGMAGSASQYGSGAQPISMSNANRERPRRESLAGSMVSGMSWGGVSVGSFIRDEYVIRLGSHFALPALLTFRSIIMEGSSPFHQQSSSFHSSSYIPKLEANFMKDFACCGLIMATLHELLRHFEENHAGSLQQRNTTTMPTALPDTKAAIASNTANALRASAHQQQSQQTSRVQSPQTSPPSHAPSYATTPTVAKAQPATAPDPAASQHRPSLGMDAVQDMEMDDVDYNPQSKPTTGTDWSFSGQPRMMQRSQFGQSASSRIAPLDTHALNMGNHLQQHQGLRHSTPTTPIAASRNGNVFHNNPTVSSVNTPTLTAHPVQHQSYMPTPDSSMPGTPGELANEPMAGVGFMDSTSALSKNRDWLANQFGNLSNFQFGNGDDMLDLCIDEPAKRLFNANGVYNGNNSSNDNQMSNAERLGDAQYSENSELAKTIREQQRLAGIPDGGSGPNDGVPKPFHCPVIGCEKAYKNHNGLKYHKAHGHNSQELHANENGTFSIVDPDTRHIYPGTLGMEKHKPYRCDACGKRYKNLNGLKYHKNHSAPCEDGKPLQAIEPEPSTLAQPTSKLQKLAPGSSANADMSGMGGPVQFDNGFLTASAPLPGIDEEMTM
ncbi:MAG: hypothetical protein Q9210_006882 [Variospora velana]